jgi:hypothetical protein
MGNTQSQFGSALNPIQPPTSGTGPVQPTPVITTSVQRTPLYDGASGLHYSGKVYTNQFQQLASDSVCSGTGSVGPDQISATFPNGVSSTTLPIDESTHRIRQSALQEYVNSLIQSGRIPPSHDTSQDQQTIDKQITADRAFYSTVQAEYCFYEVRYKASLDQFLTLAATPSASSSAITESLNATIALNARLNSLLEILNYVSNDRAQKVKTRNPKLNDANTDLQKKIAILKSQQNFLQSSDVRTRTQEEMMRFSAEKNNAMNVQIAFFVALNVVALGTIFTVYRGSN